MFHTQGSVLSVFFFLAPFFCFSDLSRAVSFFPSAAAFKERERERQLLIEFLARALAMNAIYSMFEAL